MMMQKFQSLKTIVILFKDFELFDNFKMFNFILASFNMSNIWNVSNRYPENKFQRDAIGLAKTFAEIRIKQVDVSINDNIIMAMIHYLI